MGQKVIITFLRESGLSSRYKNHLITFCRPFVYQAMHVYDCVPRQFTSSEKLHLFCLLRLISASADRIRPANFCSMIELLHELKTAVVNIEGFRHLLCLSRKKRKLKVGWISINNNKIESFLAYFMRILNSCVAQQDSVFQTGACDSQSTRTLCSTARIRQDSSGASFFRCKLL